MLFRSAEVARILQSPEARKLLSNEGVEPVANPPDAFAALMRAELDMWPKVVKAAGIKQD